MDNLRVHKLKIVMEWVKKHDSKITLFSLPPYAPQYNPVELLNNTFKHDIHRRFFPKTYEELKTVVTKITEEMKKDTTCVASFFNSEKTRYAMGI